MHSSFFYRRQRSKPRVSNLGFCKETFVIFASFCSNFFERLFTEGTKETKIGLGLNPFAPFVFFC
jgi:cytochrome c biogenesis factor